MSLNPINNHVLARIVADEKKASGLILKEDAYKPIYDVIAVARDIKEVKEGDRILIAKYMANEVSIGGEVLALIHIDKILGIFEEI